MIQVEICSCCGKPKKPVVGHWKPTGTARPSKGGGSHSCAKTTADCGYDPDTDATIALTSPATPAAELWDGWGTALKPAYEIICVAMKPIEGTFAENALKWGVAGLAIDKARIEHEEPEKPTYRDNHLNKRCMSGGAKPGGLGLASPSPAGRWPANVILDEEAAALLDQQSGEKFPGQGNMPICVGATGLAGKPNRNYFAPDTGGASRFFYCAKSSRSERDAGLEGMPEGLSRRTGISDPKWREGRGRKAQELYERNIHPTVKPLALMRYLCTLTMTPTGGVVLDPFMGSGSTGIAAKQTGRDFIGIEISSEYYEIARRRIEHAKVEPTQPALFQLDNAHSISGGGEGL